MVSPPPQLTACPRRGRPAGPASAGGGAADADRRLAQETRHDLASVVLLDQHVLAALRIGTLHGKDAGHARGTRHGNPLTPNPPPPKPGRGETDASQRIRSLPTHSAS